jgi:hypothetical protein
MKIFMNEFDISPTRASLMTKTVSARLFIKIVGLLLPCFDAKNYLDSWLLQKGHSAVDTNTE